MVSEIVYKYVNIRVKRYVYWSAVFPVKIFSGS